MPERPFFLYLAFGATHSPHQAPRAYLEKYRGRFDAGWDVVREQWFARQKALGVIPRDTKLAPRNPGRARVERAVGERAPLRRAAAGGVRRVPRPHRRADRTAGRRSSSSIGQLDNTFLVVMSDNGASQEGGAVRRARRDEVLQRHSRGRRRGGRAGSTTSAARTATRNYPVGLGAGREHAAQVVQAEHPRRRRARSADRALARTASATAAASGASSAT